MVLIKWIHNGIWGHDSYLWENQVAYTEDLQIQDPEKVVLGLKSTNIITTWNNLVMCMHDRWIKFYGAENWKIYNNSWVEVLDTGEWKTIINITNPSANYVHFSDTEDLGYVEFSDVLSSSDWSAESSYVYPVGSQNALYEYIYDWEDIVWWWIWWFYRIQDWVPWSFVDLSWVWTAVGVWKTINYFNLFNDSWSHYYSNGWTSLTSALNIILWEYKKAFYNEWLQWIISSGQPSVSKLYALWESKTLLASARLATADNKKTFYFWRNSADYLSDNWMWWKDTISSNNNYIYFVAWNGVISYGSEYPWLNKAWNILTTKNYNNEVVDDIWFVKTKENIDWSMRLYYSWRVWTTCWVDYIDLNSNVYKNSWVFYSQKLIPTDQDAWQKYKIQRIKCRANTDSDTSIIVSVSRDGWAFELVTTLSNTNQKQAHIINKHYECHELQWKFELQTTDNTKTPEFISFSFSMERIDG
jgi:hypothetical protein